MKKLFSYFFCGMSVFFLSVLVSFGCTKELTDEQKLDRIKELYSGYKKSFPDTPDVSVEELTAMQGKTDIVLIDRRDRREQEVSMVPGAITSEEFERNIERYKDKTIVVYCTIGNRSGHYAKGLIEKGMKAYNLKGSILAWAHAGEELVSEGKPTRRVHVYGPKWNLVPKEYDAVWQ